MIISKTPLRISLFGGGTDYPEYFNNYEGCVLNFAIQYYSYVTINKLYKHSKNNYYLSYKNIENTEFIKQIHHPSIKNCLKFLNFNKPIQIHYSGDLPAKTGLGSSSSFTVGLLNALYKYNKKKASKNNLAKNAIYVERELIRERVGFQDQIICSYGGIKEINFKNRNKFSIKNIVLSKDKINKLQSSIMIVFTNTERYANNILKEQIKNTKRKIINNQLEELKIITKEAINLIKKYIDIDELSYLLNKSWNLKKNLSNKISSSMIDQLYEFCLSQGAKGGKLLGAGGGGFLLLIGEKENLVTLSKTLTKKNIFSFFPKIDQFGSKIIYSDKF